MRAAGWDTVAARSEPGSLLRLFLGVATSRLVVRGGGTGTWRVAGGKLEGGGVTAGSGRWAEGWASATGSGSGSSGESGSAKKDCYINDGTYTLFIIINYS